MDFAAGYERDGNFILEGVTHFDLEAILDCGQAFRWNKTEDAGFRGVAFGKSLMINQQGERLILSGVSEAEFNQIWLSYFDFTRSYGNLKESFYPHENLRRAVEFAPGIRVLRQDGWEVICSFIISANNSIPRIKAAVERLCALFGQPIPGGYAFPTAERLALLTPDDLAPVRCGFRAKYIVDAAQAVSDGRVELGSLYTLPVEEASAALQKIKGVGPKVAACALLFGFGREECLPVDVWISRALKSWFPEGLPKEVAPVAGIAQQYIFHYARTGGVL